MKLNEKIIKTSDFTNIKYKDNLYDKINNKKKDIYLATFSTKGNKFPTTKILSKGIYIKPYNKSRSNSRGSKIHSNIEIEKEEQKILLNKIKYKTINTSFDNTRIFRNKFSHLSNLKSWHSTNSLFHTSFEIRSKKTKTIKNKIRDCCIDKYCFISKYYNCSIKVPNINICYFSKNGIKSFKKETGSQN